MSNFKCHPFDKLRIKISNNKTGFSLFIRNWKLEIGNFSRGFTFIELIVVMVIFGILISLVTLNLVQARQSTSITASLSTLVADLNAQQIKAMVGDSTVTGTPNSAYGIYFEPNTNRYILFKGTSYSPSSSTNYTAEIDSSLVFSPVSFPNSQVVFATVSGELINFNQSQSSVTLNSANSEDQKTLQFNKYGKVTSVN